MPTELLTVFVATPVAVLCAMTLTAGIASPFGSVTVPVSTASAPWPKTEILSDRRSEAVAKSLDSITDLLEIAPTLWARGDDRSPRAKGAALYRYSKLDEKRARYPSNAVEASVQEIRGK